ncbi:MAG: hypothetical protein U0746_07725 [Gemmataceae bacterium]
MNSRPPQIDRDKPAAPAMATTPRPCWRCSLVAVMVLAGCAAGRDPVHPVAGQVLVNGRPAADAMIVFHPVGVAAGRAVRPVGRSDADGCFRLMTYVAGDGAPAGEYAATVVWPDRSLPVDECLGDLAHDRFKGRYADPARSPWRFTVVPGPNAVEVRIVDGWLMPRLRDIDAATRP